MEMNLMTGDKMTRNAIVKRIYREMKNGQDSLVEYKHASKVLSIVEKVLPYLKNEWDWKPKKTRKK